MSRDMLEKFTRHRPNYHKSAPEKEVRNKPKNSELKEENKSEPKKNLKYSEF